MNQGKESLNVPRGAKPIRRARTHRHWSVHRPCDDERGLRASTLAVASTAPLLDRGSFWASLDWNVVRLCWHHHYGREADYGDGGCTVSGGGPPLPPKPPLPPTAVGASGRLAVAALPLPPVAAAASGKLAVPPAPVAPTSAAAGCSTAPSRNARNWLESEVHPGASAAIRQTPGDENVFMVSTSQLR